MKIVFSKRAISHLYRFVNVINKLKGENIIIKVEKDKLYYIYKDSNLIIYLITKVKPIDKDICISVYRKNILNMLKTNVGKVKVIIDILKRKLYIRDNVKKYINRSFLIKNYLIEKERFNELSGVFLDTSTILDIFVVGNVGIKKYIKEEYASFVVNKKKLTYFTYDEYRMLVIRTLCSIPNTNLKVVISSLVLGILHKVLITSKKNLFKLEVDKKSIIITVENIIIKSGILSINRVNYKDIVKKEKGYNYIYIYRKELKEAIELFKKISSKKDSYFILEISKEHIYLKHKVSEIEQVESKINVYKGKCRGLKIKLNTEFIREFIGSLKEKYVVIGLKNELSKMFLISKSEEREIIYCIMPLA
ncbi:hypothetical protein JSR06_00560 [Candidatus Vidania fulgoroideae]|uniref:Beta sliding clamp n=1 Tax=Candidatus Vidania fulgoroideorum TaxID=881286 RepID=A0A974X9P4_9PROT|nr:hypothetical protein JSR06_00560 [Candidatus Vidania fulgoroideae]